jgi:putative membrane protein
VGGEPSDSLSDGNAKSEVGDHLANERTYLTWVRTGIAAIALGFVVAKFELLVRELAPSAPTTSFGFSSIVGIALVLAGGLMQVLALSRFTVNQGRIKSGRYEPSRGIEIAISAGLFAIALLLTVYLILTV